MVITTRTGRRAAIVVAGVAFALQAALAFAKLAVWNNGVA
jgi:hypothetical protein